MNIIVFILLTTMAIFSNADVIRTVFCRKQCSDYLDIPENSMPLCAPGHLQLKECGTVVNCDWAEADRDKVRPIANSSDILCCYRTTIKQKGDCIEQVVNKSDHTDQSFFCFSNFHFLPWILCIVFLTVVVVQAGYIVKLRISGYKHKKIIQSDEMNCLQAAQTQPLVDEQRHSDTTRSFRVPILNELHSSHLPNLNTTGSE